MLAGTVEGLVYGLDVRWCCCCLDHRVGVELLGVCCVVAAAVGLTVATIVSVEVRDACVTHTMFPCIGGGGGNEEDRRNGTSVPQFYVELVVVYEYFKPFLPSWTVWLAAMSSLHVIVMLVSAVLVVGAFRSNKNLLIPWLITAKFTVVTMLCLSVGTVLAECRLFRAGGTVFGLMSLAALAAASAAGYFWIVVQALYIRFEIDQMNGNENNENIGNETELCRDNAAFAWTEADVDRCTVVVVDCKEEADGMPLTVLRAQEDSPRDSDLDAVQVSQV